MLVVALTGLLPVVCWAQDEKAPVIDYEARVKSVETLQQHIAQREQRFEEFRKDLRVLDERVEKQIDFVVKTLSAIKDSQDSKTRVANVKEDVMQSLVRNMKYIRQKRADVFERLRRDPAAPQAQLEKQLAVLDERVNKRLEQVMELAESFPGHKDVSKYESDGGSYWNGWYDESTRVSDEWKQNRRESNAGDVVRRELLQGIEKAMENFKSRRAAIVDNLANRKLSEQDRKAQQEELGRIDANLDNLRMRRREVVMPGSGATQAVGRDEIHDMEQLLDDARDDLARDFNDIMIKFTQLDREGTRIHAMRENLKAREEWLKNNPPPAK